MARFFEEVGLLDKVNPVSSAVQVNGSWVSVANFPNFVAKFQVGLIAATGTLTLQLRQAKDASGTDAKAFKVSAAYTDTADNIQVWIDCKTEELDINNGFDFVRLEMVAATAASLVSAELLGYGGARYSPVTKPASLTIVT